MTCLAYYELLQTGDSIFFFQGYFGALLSCIESFLASINVKHLVLPTTHETESKWINKFGFSRASQYEVVCPLGGLHIVTV